jgi:hypothetical protein
MSDNAAGVSYAFLVCALIAFFIFNVRSCEQAQTTEAIKAGLVQGEHGRWVKPTAPVIIRGGAE